jgi:hypothetical protein
VLRRTALLLATVAFVTACENPAWRFDHIEITAKFNGTTCDVRVDGKALSENIPSHTLMMDQDDQTDPTAPPGTRFNFWACEGISVMLSTIKGQLPKPGTYPVSYGYIYPALDTASVGVRSRELRRSGAELHALSGTLTIDRIAFDTVYGSLRAIGRRAPAQP